MQGTSGFHQKIKHAASSSLAVEPSSGMSHLAELLIEQWSWGLMSCPQIQSIAHAAKLDMQKGKMAVPHDLDRIATLGASGQYPGNMHKCLCIRLDPPILSPALSTVHLWMKRTLQRTEQVYVNILLPHQVFAVLYKYPFVFKEMVLGGDADNVSKFWGSMEGSARYNRHPLKGRPAHKNHCVPIGFHGDGVPVTGVSRSWSKSCEAFSWSSLLYNGPTRLANFLIFFCFATFCCTTPDKHTMNTFWKLLRWSFFWLWKGRWPTADVDGAKIDGGGGLLAGGYFAAIWQVKGDLDYFNKTLKLEYIGSRSPCVKCKCNLSTIPWTGTTRDAAWLGHLRVNDGWLEDHPDAPAIFTLPGVGIDSITLDWMHVKHLGMDQYLYASVLAMLVYEIDGHRMLPDDPATNLEAIWGRPTDPPDATSIEGWYTRNKFDDGFGQLTLSMLGQHPTDGFPCLKGKAAECRSLGRPLLEIWTARYDRTKKFHRIVRLCLEKSIALESLLDENKSVYRFTDADAVRFREACWDLAALITTLGNEYHPKAIFLFHYTIKTHLMIHAGLEASEISPRVGWCYSGESAMRLVKELMQASCRGSCPALTMSKAMLKYSFGMSYTISKRIGWWRI